MQFRELKQHHLPAIITVAALFITDSLSFLLAYAVAENTGSEFIGIKYPFRVYILISFKGKVLREDETTEGS